MAKFLKTNSILTLAIIVWLFSGCTNTTDPVNLDQKPMFNCLLIADDSLYNGAELKNQYKPNITFLSGVLSSPISSHIGITLNGNTPDSISPMRFVYLNLLWQ
jgi:hypothetical protein